MERKKFLSSHIVSSPFSLAAKRRLTSLCGILLLISIIFSSNGLEVSSHAQNDLSSLKDVTFKGLILSLNVVFFFAFLASTLSIIKNEDNVQGRRIN